MLPTWDNNAFFANFLFIVKNVFQEKCLAAPKFPSFMDFGRRVFVFQIGDKLKSIDRLIC